MPPRAASAFSTASDLLRGILCQHAGLACVIAIGRAERSMASRVERSPECDMSIDHADAVHLRDHLAAHAGDAAILRLVAAGAEQRLVVVGELHEAYAERVQDLDEPMSSSMAEEFCKPKKMAVRPAARARSMSDAVRPR